MKASRTLLLVLALGTFGIFASCRSSPPATLFASSGDDLGKSGKTGGTGGASGSDLGFGGARGTGGADGGQSDLGGASSCAGTAQVAKGLPLDMILLLDRSGSMRDATGAGPTKWAAVTGAMESFFADPASAGLGVGLQFFPLEAKDVPPSCTTDAECGAYGPCYIEACTNDIDIACGVDADCDGAGPCVPVGQCSDDPTNYCFDDSYCGAATCLPAYDSVCINTDSCQIADYATPAVPVSELNGASGALDQAIAGFEPHGSTPTEAALQGAIAYARGWAAAHPTRKVVVVLATDGAPTECVPTNITAIAALVADGVAGTPSINTFCIGVFAPADVATGTAALDAFATAGGTMTPFIVDATMDVNAPFLDALNTIRGAKLACEYQIPTPPAGDTLDFGAVNVEHTAAGATKAETVYYVGSAAACDPVKGGWYYDVDPKMGTPTKILLCPATCEGFGLGGSVDIRLGCSTIVPPPK